MSVLAGRMFVAIAAIVLLACAWWLWAAATGADSQPAAAVVPAVIGLVAAVALMVAIPLFDRFGETTIEHDALVVRSVLRPRRTVALTEIVEVVVIESLLLPARSASSARRLVIRTRASRVVAVTPRDGRVLDQLRRLPVPLTTDVEPLTTSQVAHRYPAPVSVSERLLGAMLWAAVIVPVIVVIWVVLSH